MTPKNHYKINWSLSSNAAATTYVYLSFSHPQPSYSIIPLDSSGAGGTVSALDQQRSFNLVRLRAIEVSRNLAATSFYQEELNLTTDQSSVADNNNSNSGSIDNIPDPVSGAGRASAASRYGRDTVLTPALIHLQLEQFNDYYYHQQKLLQQQQPQVATTVQSNVNLQFITLGCLDDGTNESSTKSLMFQVLFFFILFIDLWHSKLFIFIL